MFLENDEILDSKNVFLVLNVLLFGLHEDIDLVEGQLHVLLFWTNYFDGNLLLGFVIKCFDNLPKCSRA